MNKYTKPLFFTGLVLLVYGFLCRAMNIYFFWDSQVLGYIILLVSLLAFLIGQYKKRKAVGKKTLWTKIAIGFLGFGLVLLPIVITILRSSNAYRVATEYIRADKQLADEIGSVTGFGLIPSGSVSITSANGVQSGEALFNLIVKGEKKFKDVRIRLVRSDDGWEVVSMN